ncbi:MULTISPECIES: DUF1330 domain-containing protein [Streptomyces]|uniref:DUF1330 domain-containing protein n=2 Tax=Streptomyces TaxID=1883 RepID=A0ABV9IN93_9ACTN
MPKGYVIVTEAIKDPEGMEAYTRAAGPSMAESGARPLVVDDQPRVLEGEWHGSRTVVLEFESVEAARAWYDSDAYTEARPLRQAAAESHAVLLSGFEPPRA